MKKIVEKNKQTNNKTLHPSVNLSLSYKNEVSGVLVLH